MPRFLRTPKGQTLVVFLALLAIAAPGQGGLAVAPQVATGILAACAVDLGYTYWESRRWIVPTSALLTGLIVAGILGPQEPLMVVAWVAGFAIVGKHVLRTHREHIFNPAALALLASSLFFGSGQSWWGALGDAPWPFAVVLLLGGVFIVDRLNKFPLVLTFLAAYFGGFTLIALIAPGAVAEMFRSPFVQAALFLACFMLTDPPTSPNRVEHQVWYGLLTAGTAIAAQLLGAGQVYLLLAVLAGNLWLGAQRWWSRRPTSPAPPADRGVKHAPPAGRYVAVPARTSGSRAPMAHRRLPHAASRAPYHAG